MHYKIYTGWICPRNYYGSFCPNKTTAKKKKKNQQQSTILRMKKSKRSVRLFK